MGTDGKPISRKVLAQFLTTVGIYLVALAVTRLGIDLDPATSQLVASAVAIVAGLLAGYLKREVPGIVSDDDSKTG